MATLYYDQDADLSILKSRTIAVIGYGSQGHAHALNLRDSGLDVIVGLPAKSRSRDLAETAGLQVFSVADATARASIVMLAIPDTVQEEVYRTEIAPYLKAGDTVLFAHGFNIRYQLISPDADLDVALIAPKSPGHRVREVFVAGGGTPGLVAVEQDASGTALATALAYARGIGCTRAGVIATTFAEETETDLFGEQVVLCGGVTALVRSAFERLVAAGYQPEVAYFECLHELKLIVDLIYRGGLGEMWQSVSDTAEHGGYEAGNRIVNEDVETAMDQVLAEIQNGAYARRWIDENRRGRPWFDARRQQEQEHPIEQVGVELRGMMGFLGEQSAT